MIKNFLFWVLGTFEDSPLPYEINHIFFCLCRKNNFAYLCFGGTEFLPKKIFNFDFFPLEAQFFALGKKWQNFSLSNLRQLIEKSTQNQEFFQHFLNKKIHFGVFESNEIFDLE